jgi:hypothetical protein
MPKLVRSYRARVIEWLMASGHSPEIAQGVWDLMEATLNVVFTGVMFALLSYFIFAGAYLKMFGLYLVYDTEILYCLLYELIFLVSADIPIIELLFSLEVCCTCFFVGLIHVLTAVTLDISVWFIQQLIRMPFLIIRMLFAIIRVPFAVIQILLAIIEALFNVLWYLNDRLSDFVSEAPWTYCFLLVLFNCLFLIAEPLDYLKGLGSLVVWILRVLFLIVVIVVSATLSFLPTVWDFCSMALERSREPFLKAQRFLRLLLERIFSHGFSVWKEFWTIFWWMLEPLTALLKALDGLCLPRRSDEAYTYTPLKAGREIRLLQLHGKITGTLIRGELIPTPIDELPAYECISYVWGEPTGKETIILNGQKFEVSSNVHEILYQRRAIFSRRILWIDSICINQEDKKERTDQVKKMQTIYGKASRVTICLGNPPDASEARLLILKLWIHVIGRNPTTWNDTILASYGRARNRNGGAIPPEWLALRRLLRNPWFERCWVVQELTLASNVFLLYGGNYIPWFMFISLLSVFTQEQSTVTRRMITNDADGTISSSTPVAILNGLTMETFRIMYRNKITIELHKVLRICLSFHASDPRDKVFALQGITEAAEAIPIDYEELSVEEVLINTARYFMKRPEALEVLQLAGIGWTEDATDLKIPSWVVDWSKSKGIEACSLASLSSEKYTVYKAAVEEKPQIRNDLDDNAIELGGLHVDHIKTLGNIMPSPSRDGQLVNQSDYNDKWIWWFQETTSMIQYLPLQYHTGQTRSEAYWRTCICDHGWSNRPATSDYEQKFMDWKESLYKKYLEDHSWDPTCLSQDEQEFLQGRENDPRPFKERFEGGYAFSNALGASCNGRCFAITEEGYMAIVPPGTKEGDMVCLFMGAQVPFLLRPLSTSDGERSNQKPIYQLVGECYVHGMMDGEGMRQGLRVQKFYIQ